ncbi:MAG: metallophosphoesterase family protein [Kiritimatiellae bacterium]|nr:metallophosphoesterase family protein [Kiritimatiellia bacterium]
MSKKAKLLATRKEFLSGAAAVGAAPFVRTWGADGGKPLWKAGLMTDTHVHKTMESCSRVRAACELFAKHEVDLVVNCGDIAELYYPTGFQSLRKVYSESFRDRKLEEVWVYANHDRLRRKEPWQEVMKDVRRLLEIPHEPYASIDFKGYPLIVFPQWLNYERAKAMLDEACAKYPGKPVFVFDHVPPRGTTDNSITWGSSERREFYAKYPRVVLFTGHAHGSLRSELNIWQGDFTTVSLGCLS